MKEGRDLVCSAIVRYFDCVKGTFELAFLQYLGSTVIAIQELLLEQESLLNGESN